MSLTGESGGRPNNQAMVQTRIRAYLEDKADTNRSEKMADSTEDDNSEQIIVSHSKPGKKPVSHKKNTGKKDQQKKRSTKKNADNGNKATKKSKKTQMSCPLSPNFNVSLTELLASPTPMPNNSGAVVDDPMNAGNSTSNSEPAADVQARDNDTSTVTNEVLSQMTLQSDTIKSLEAQIEILQSELSANKKTDSYKKSQIKNWPKRMIIWNVKYQNIMGYENSQQNPHVCQMTIQQRHRTNAPLKTNYWWQRLV